MYYVTKLVLGLEHPDWVIIRLKLKQELFSFFLLLFYLFGLTNFPAWFSEHSPEVPFFLSARDI